MITLSCEEVRREISNYLDDDMSPRMRRLLEVHLGSQAVDSEVFGVSTGHERSDWQVDSPSDSTKGFCGYPT